MILQTMPTARVGAWVSRIALRCAALGFAFAAGAEAGLSAAVEFQVNRNTYVQLYAAVASLQDGGFVVAWQNATNVFIGDVLTRHFDAVGEATGGEFVVDTSGYGGFAFRGRPTIASASDDRVVVASRDPVLRVSIHGRSIDSDGSPLGEAFEINANTAFHQRGGPHIATLTDGGLSLSGTLSIRMAFDTVASCADSTVLASLRRETFRSATARRVRDAPRW